MAHYVTTGPEILEQMEGKVDYVFLSAGTGGTVTGICSFLKKALPSVKIIGIDHEGSIIAYPDSINKGASMYKLEGIGQSEIPGILKREEMDEWVKINDKESFKLARELIKTEGFLTGATCGSVLQGAFEYLKKNNLHHD